VRVFALPSKKLRGTPRGLVRKSSPVKKEGPFDNWLPEDTIAAIREFRVAIKGPLTTPWGGEIRSLNVALRRSSTSYNLRGAVKYYRGVPSPVKHPERMIS